MIRTDVGVMIRNSRIQLRMVMYEVMVLSSMVGYSMGRFAKLVSRSVSVSAPVF